MEYNIYAVKDEMTETFLTPIFVERESEAIRSFTWQINNTPIWDDNASDFSLYQLGYFNSNTGELKGEMKKIISGHSVRREKK